ncbi:synaptic vesicle glycoprotein 2C isoform X3 [Toxorhynchites rutilus septentrionalis]|uniref:synaptic vesicle glycoprotein 2C isoform X3 n=1 Tax=Toxorhynchites rutilus septentrionalis TaxID=329112 RepID=UPI00247A3B0D|nr:synaptic vesicle glycoprotein 2C isoform X3 [Toxorhynchites rutilus septentrionalis]
MKELLKRIKYFIENGCTNVDRYEIQPVHLRDVTTYDDSKTPAYSYNEALQLVGEGKFHTFLLFVCGFCLMSVINETLNVGFIISAAECDLNLSYSDKGMLNGAAFCGVVVSSHLWGFLSDTWGRRKVILLATSCGLAFAIVSSFSVHVWMLIATRFCVGFFMSGNAATCYAYLAEFHTDKSRAKVVSYAGMFMALGMIYLPVVAWFIIPLDATLNLYIEPLDMRFSLWRVYLLLSSLASVLILIGILNLPESGKFLLTIGEKEKVVQILAKMYRWNQGKPEHTFPVKSIALDAVDSAFADEMRRKSTLGLRYVWEQTVPLFRSPLVGNTVRAAFLMFGLFMASSGLFMWMPDILNTYINYKDEKITICQVVDIIHHNRTANASETANGNCPVHIDANIFVITAVMGIIFLLGYMLNGAIINVVGKKMLLNIWYVACGVCGIAALWTSDFYLTLLVIVVFLAVGCLGSVLSAISVDLFPTNYRSLLSTNGPFAASD